VKKNPSVRRQNISDKRHKDKRQAKSGTEQTVSDKMPTKSLPLGGVVAPKMRPQTQIRLHL